MNLILFTSSFWMVLLLFEKLGVWKLNKNCAFCNDLIIMLQMKQKYHHCTIWYGHFSIISLLSSLMNTSGAFPGSLTLVQTVYYIFFYLSGTYLWCLNYLLRLLVHIMTTTEMHCASWDVWKLVPWKVCFKFLLHCSCSRCVQSTSFVESDT